LIKIHEGQDEGDAISLPLTLVLSHIGERRIIIRGI